MSEQKYIVSVSGGLGSVEAWERCLKKHGPENTIPVFADVGTVVEFGKVVSGEDEDLFRFLEEVENHLGQKCHKIRHPKYRDVWDAFFHARYVTNGRIDNCSKYLKREVLHKFEAQHPGSINVIGFSWLEESRMSEYKLRNPKVWFPLAEKPFLTNPEITAIWEARGVKQPRLYERGFSHNNCGGMCFKAGLGQAYDLWKWSPHRYEYNERMQEKFFRDVSPHGTFLERQGQQISLQNLRLQFESGYVPKTSQYRTCGGTCMIPDETEGVATAPKPDTDWL